MTQPIQYSYNPPPNEMPLYEALFAAADPQSLGYITGPSAVQFLSASKLPVDLLKTIWTMADQPSNNMLDKSKFIVAVRLIQLFQNGKRPVDGELRLGPGENSSVRPPFFEGVNVTNLTQPQEMTSPQQQRLPSMTGTPQPSPLRPPQPTLPSSTALTTTDAYTMTPAEQSRYSQLFPTYAIDSHVSGPAAYELFSKSGLDRDSLKTIWNMADEMSKDNALDLMEFCVAMHLIVCVSKKGLGMPSGGLLPGSLRGWLEKKEGGSSGGGGETVVGPPQVNREIQSSGMAGQNGMGGQMMQQPQQQQVQMTTSPGSPDGIPSPDKMGMYNMGPQQGGASLPPPPVYGMQQHQQQLPQPMNAMGGGGAYNSMGGQVEHPAPNISTQGGAVGGETVDDAFAGLSNSPVEDVDEYSAVGGSAVGGMPGGMGTQNNSSVPSSMQSNNFANQQQMSHPVPTPSMGQQQQPTSFTPASPKATKSHYDPSSPTPTIHSRTYTSPKLSRKDIAINEEFNSELEKLRSAHQKLQAEVVSLRAKASLVSEEEQEAQAEMRTLAASIAELSLELTTLKDEVTESQGRLKESLGMLKAQKEKKESLETAIKDTREINDSLHAANEAVNEANEAMLKENAHAVAASAAAAEAKAEAPVENDDLFSWDVAPPAPPVTVTQSHSRGMSDMSHSYGQNWGVDNASATGDIEPKKEESTQSVHSMPTEQTANTGYSSAAPTANPGVQTASHNGGFPTDQQSVGGNSAMQPAPYGGFPSDQQSVGGHSAMQSAPFGGYPMGAAPSTAMVAAPSSGNYDYGMDLMGMGAMAPMSAPIPETQPAAFHAPEPDPVPPSNMPKSPTMAEVESVKKEALNAERSFRQSKELVDTLMEQVQNLEMVAKQAQDNLIAAEKKKGSFTAKSKKKKEVAAAQEQVNAERQKVNEAREQLAAAKKEAESTRKLAEDLRQKSEKIEMEAATAASMQQQAAPHHSNGYDSYGGFMGGAQNQGGYSNPFAMG